MPSYTIYKDGKPAGRIRGDLGPWCTCCRAVSEYLCDYPVGAGKTCSLPLCPDHASAVGDDTHYCPSHMEEWVAAKEAEGVKVHLDNVVPLPNRRRPIPSVEDCIARFASETGDCCAACRWWCHVNAVSGECYKSAPVSGWERLGLMDMESVSLRVPAGHVFTPRGHLCGDFERRD